MRTDALIALLRMEYLNQTALRYSYYVSQHASHATETQSRPRHMRSCSLLTSISPRIGRINLRTEIQIPPHPNLIHHLALHLRNLTRRTPASLIRAPSISLPRLRNYTRIDDVVERVHAIAQARHVHLVGMVDHDAAVAVAGAAVDRRPAVLLPAAGRDLAAEGLRGGGALGGGGLPGSGAFVVEGAGVGGRALAWEEGGEGGVDGWEDEEGEDWFEGDG